MGSMHQTRLSFSRSLIRSMVKNNWKVSVHLWALDNEGYGTVIYKIDTPNNTYHQVIFSDKILDEERNDRVIAEKWDVTFALVHGDINDALLSDLRNNIPLQESGRNNNHVWVLARANKSVRIFEHVVSSLAKGQQPSHELIAEVGYILRTTAVYGNGKFGIADFRILEEHKDFRESFRAQMLAVYILREFSIDWVHYLAKQRNSQQAVTLDRDLQRYLGVGNATGLGMALFLIKHPRIIDKWISIREKALSEIAVQTVDDTSKQYVLQLLRRARQHIFSVFTIDEQQKELNINASAEIEDLIVTIKNLENSKEIWKSAITVSMGYGLETQEILIACLLDVYPEISDTYEDDVNADEQWISIVGVSIKELRKVLQDRYRWAINIDFTHPNNVYWFWYRSEEKVEPRIGVREEEAGTELELPLDIGRQVHKLYNVITTIDDNCHLSEFLIEHPEFSTITRRVWTMGNSLFGDIQANSLQKENTPMYFLRSKLAMLGATKFDPRSDKWVRVTFFQNAPLLDELHTGEWLFPLLPKEEHTLSENIQQKDTILLSYNEIVLYCYWAFSGLRKNAGEPMRVATMIADMEIIQLEGIKHFARALKFIEKNNATTPIIESKSADHIIIDLQNCSIIFHLPVLIDYLVEQLYADRALEQIAMRIKSCYNRWLSLGALIDLMRQQLYVKASWNNDSYPNRVECMLSPDDIFPDIYFFDKSKSDCNDNSIDIIIGKKPINLKIDTKKEADISHDALQQKQKISWEKGIFIDKEDWDIIQKAATKIMVENTERSQLGAGGK